MAGLKIEALNKVYPNGVQAVSDFNMDIQDGEFVVLVGPSGCGKSTTLRMIAGLEGISSGKLLLNEIKKDSDGKEEVTIKDITNIAPKDRDIAMVFQNYALYPQMTVYENMAFSLMLRKENANIIHEKVRAAAELLGLTNQLNKKPRQLSGGQRQRVAVGRAIVRNPKIFLFDEPLSNLDAKLRGQMRHELKLLHQRLKATMIYVTHDQIEALTLADRIVCMSGGYVQQIGKPIELYEKPANLFVAGFIGLPAMNFFDVQVSPQGKLIGDGFEINLTEQNKKVLKNYVGKNIILGCRPEHVTFGSEFEVKVHINENLGQFTVVHGYLGKKLSVFKLPGWHNFKQGEVIKLDFVKEKIHFFDKITTDAIREEV